MKCYRCGHGLDRHDSYGCQAIVTDTDGLHILGCDCEGFIQP